MRVALYGPSGFYRRSDAPSANFRTAAHTGPAWSGAILELATRVEEALGAPDDFAVVDVGAGGGELLSAIAAVAPSPWTLIGVDVAPRPQALPEHVSWTDRAPTGITGLVLAVELLDVVPVDVVELSADGPRYVEVDRTGEERLGALVDGADLDWLRQWWALANIGDRAEIGLGRDEMWWSLTASVRRGLAVAVDYAVDPRRNRTGTLTGYRDGRQVRAVPDGSCDLTAHVVMEPMIADGDELVPQREALQRLGVRVAAPSYAENPASYLNRLAAAGEAAELLDPSGLGGFEWLLQGRGIAVRDVLPSR